jgi:prepilin-type N-terminal cleavage/methylation domain-containing protein
MTHSQTQRGVTLIELVVGIAIMAAVMLTAVPLTSSWVDSSIVTETKASLQKAFSKTKTISLENSAHITDGTAAAYMCVLSGVVYVHSISQGTCGINPIWKTVIKGNVALSVSGASFNCIGLNNIGLPVALTLPNGNVCTVSKVITVRKADISDEKTLY